METEETLRPLALDPVERGAVRVLEHFLGRYHEGPSLPARFADEVEVFSRMSPDAGPEGWAEFALALARSAWQQAYVRGAEWRERREAGEPEPEHDDEESIFADPEMAAALERAVAEDPLAAGVPAALEALDREGEAGGGFRIFVDGRS